MKRVVMVILSLFLAATAWAQSQTTPKNSNPPTASPQSATQKSSNASILEKAKQKLEEGKKKLQHDIDKNTHKVRDSSPVFGVRG
jgi:Ni/Co efflux regulator RcnB